MALKGLNLAGLAKKPMLPAPRVLDPNRTDFGQVLKTETQIADATIAITDEIINGTPGGGQIVEVVDATETNIDSEEEKLSRLVDDDFPFDESQLAAVHGLVTSTHGCLIGAAGTGKTTVSRKFVDLLRDGLPEVDMSQYWKRGVVDEHDEYETPEKLIPSIVICSFTGRATQMSKKNFPRDWHGNIMTIHRMLGFYPEFYEDIDFESGNLVNKRRFVPSYTAANKMPWKIIIIEEAGMLGLDLWHQLIDACEPDCRIYMIGDIQQLPPTHGKSILGFALAKWPTYELTHVHRQQGANNSIVDNAHRILKGLRPISDCPEELSFRTPPEMVKALSYMAANKDWRFLTVSIDDKHAFASQRIRQALKLLHGKLYEPNRDVVITPINGFEQTSPGYSLGQSPMNQALVTMLNQDSPRYLIDAGRERMNFAVGDKVMATINDYENGITNGMTGIITRIAENGGYVGDTRRFGLVSEVNAYYDGLVDEDDEDIDFSLEEMAADSQAGVDELKKKEKRDAGPASHAITVQFGEGEHGFEIAFGSKSQVASLMLAYVATCHKMQGGEAPLVFVIAHQENKRPLNREWLYTAVTRASQRCVLLTTRQGQAFALGKQTIKGTTLKQKVETFIALTEVGMLGPTVRVRLPRAMSMSGELIAQPARSMTREETSPVQVAEAEPARLKGEAQGASAAQEAPRIKVGAIHIHIHESPKEADPVRPIRDGGELHPVEPGRPAPAGLLGRIAKVEGPARAPQLPPPVRLTSQWGAYHTAVELGHVKLMANRLLTHQPPKKLNALAAILAKQKQAR